MRIKQTIVYSLATTICLLLMASSAGASTPTTMTLNNTSGDAVQVAITGAINSNIQLSFLPPGATTVTSIVFGTTNGNGNFSTIISSGGYGIPAGAPVFASINGVQSLTTLWPTYASSLSFSQTSVALAIGQNLTVTASNSLILSTNSAPTIIATAVSGSQITITGLATGSGTLILCGTSAGCGSIAVDVGEVSGASGVTFNKNNVVLNVGQSSGVTILSGSRNGYMVKSNSNSTALQATITGTSNAIWLYGKAAGTAAVIVCSVESTTNCANLNVTVLDTVSSALSFSQNNLLLTPGLTQNVTVSDGLNDSYYISSNSNSGVVSATLSGNTLTLTGGATAATAVVTVCSTLVNNTCGALNVTLVNNGATAPSATTLSFSQNVVSLAQGNSSTVTVTGGSGLGYSVSSNSNPAIATASINNGSNIITLYGNAEGSALVTVCSSSSGAVCASLYVTVGPALSSVFLSQNNISLITGQKFMVIVSGGGSANTVYSNSSPNAISADSSNNGTVILLTGGAVSGSATIVICPSTTYSVQCANLYATNTASTVQAAASAQPAGTPVYGDLIKASTPAIYYLGSNGKRYVFPNEKTFKTWYPNFNGIKTVSDAELAGYQIGGNVTYKPGSKMIKVTTDPKVYAIDTRGQLRWITSESVAIALYGANWAKMIEDVPDAFFVNYTTGTPIYSSSDFNPSSASAVATSINLDKGLGQ